LAGVSYSQRGDRFIVVAAVPAAGSTAAPVTVQGLSQLLGETEDETNFFDGRVHALIDAEMAR
jgi:hypothetical protein